MFDGHIHILANRYDFSRVKKWVGHDRRIMRSLGVAPRVAEKIFGGNLQRFLGLSQDQARKQALRPRGII